MAVDVKVRSKKGVMPAPSGTLVRIKGPWGAYQSLQTMKGQAQFTGLVSGRYLIKANAPKLPKSRVKTIMADNTDNRITLWLNGQDQPGENIQKRPSKASRQLTLKDCECALKAYPKSLKNSDNPVERIYGAQLSMRGARARLAGNSCLLEYGDAWSGLINNGRQPAERYEVKLSAEEVWKICPQRP